MKKLLFLLLFLPAVAKAVNPFNSNPDTPQKVYRNDLEIYNEMDRRIKRDGQQRCIDAPTFCVDHSSHVVILGKLSPGVLQVVAKSSNVVSGQVSLSSQVTGVLPSANMSRTGQVIQSSQSIVSIATATSGTSFVNSSLSCTLPSVISGDKVRVSGYGMVDNTTATDNTFWTIVRGSTNLGDATNGFGRGTSASGGMRFPWSVGPYLDTPPGGGTTTYTIQIRVDAGSGGLCLSGDCGILCEEIGQ